MKYVCVCVCICVYVCVYMLHTHTLCTYICTHTVKVGSLSSSHYWGIEAIIYL